MAFLGKEYKFVKDENFDAFIDSMDIPEEYKQILRQLKPSVRIEKDGDKYVLYTSAPGYNREVSFLPGVEFEEVLRDKFKANSTYSVDGNKITQVQKFENGDVINFVREFNGDELIMSITYNKWGGVANRFYKA